MYARRLAGLVAFGADRRAEIPGGSASAMDNSPLESGVLCTMADVTARSNRPRGRLSRTRMRTIRRQIKQRRYDLNSRIAAILDRLLADLTP
jgi:hypothetical protein